MRNALVVAALVICALPATAAAQKPENHLYGFTGPGKFAKDRTTFSAAGFEHIGGGGVGGGLEFAFLSGVGPFRGGDRTETTSSLNINFVLSDTESLSSRATPFFLAGISFLENPTTDTELAFLIGGSAGLGLTIR